MGLFSRAAKRPPLTPSTVPTPTFDPNSPTNARAWFKYAENTPPLSAQQWCGLALTHLQSVAWDMPLNTLSTFNPRPETIAGLANGWGISSTDAARQQLNQLLSARADDYLGEVRDRTETREVLVQVGMLDQVGGELPSVAAWDLSRITLVTRMCVDAGYLGDDEAWQWVMTAADRSVLRYESIIEFGDAFAVGRVAWTVSAYGGEDAAQIVPEAKQFAAALVHLAQDADSPWRTVPWPSPQR